MDFTTLTAAKDTPGSIRNWINYTLLPIEDVLEDAQAYVYGALRVREMRTRTTLMLADNASEIEQPARMLEPYAIFDASGMPLRYFGDPAQLEREIPRDITGTVSFGTPGAWTVEGTTLRFDARKRPGDTVALTVLHSATPAPLSVSNPTNFLTVRYPNIIRAACLMVGADYRDDDEKYTRFKNRTDELIVRANYETDLTFRGAEFPAR